MSGRIGPANYDYVQIGTQKWMTRNLDVAVYRNGDPIPRATSLSEWATITTGAWIWLRNNPTINPIAGKLYNWYAVQDPRGLAPLGWHIPDTTEWQTLITYTGGYYSTKLKSDKYPGPLSPNGYTFSGTNEYGFNAVPHGIAAPINGGWIDTIEFQPITEFWRSDIGPYEPQQFVTIQANEYPVQIQLSSVYYTNYLGLSVRCIKD